MSQDGQNLNLPWFRLYTEFAFDPKVQMLSEAMQRRFIMLLCLYARGDLQKMSKDQIAYVLKINAKKYQKTVETFQKIGLTDQNGCPLNWDKRQKPSDHSKQRVRDHRAKQHVTDCNRYIPVTVTGDRRLDLDLDQDKDILDHHHHDLDLSTPPNFVTMLEPYFEGLSFGGATNVKMFSMFKDWEAIGVIEGDFLTARDFLIEKQIFPTSPLYYHRMVIDFAKCRLKNNNYDKVTKKKETPLDKYVREEKERTGIDIREAALGSVSERSN